MSSDRESIGVLTPLVGYHLRRASGAFSVDYAAAMDGTGLRQVPFAVLSVIAANSGINQGAVGRVLGIKRANMVALINELIDMGLVDRTTDPVDRRAFALTLTATGADVLNDCVARIEAHEQRMLADFTPKERETLLHLLSRVERREVQADDSDN